MNTTRTQATTGSKPRRALRRMAAAAAVSAALVGSAGAVAQAAVTLDPGSSTLVPTWFWSTTTICVQNIGGFYGQFTLSAAGSATETDWVPPYTTDCRSAHWWGIPVTVKDTGYTRLSLTSY